MLPSELGEGPDRPIAFEPLQRNGCVSHDDSYRENRRYVSGFT
jgi:hypothetical protein